MKINHVLLKSLLFGLIFFPSLSLSQTISFYVDKKTKQVFTEPGPGREILNVQMVKAPESTTPVSAASTATTPHSTSVSLSPQAAPSGGNTPAKSWYEKLSVRGYTQFRSTYMSDDDDVKWYHPADRSVAPDQSFLIRRGRVILSGDVSDHLYVYVQPELNAAPSDGDFSTQLRDLYSDIALDKEKSFRLRVGQSKVPFGFVNLQSSQNRLAMERPDAINSAVEGERDLGTYFFWAPPEIRERFATLVKDGLKGSGDYGVLAIGAFNGQGLNRSDSNDSPHVLARASYPFKFANGQYFEPGIQAYGGKFVPRTREITLSDGSDPYEPEYDKNGIEDKRMGFSAILYPQPVGFEAEWNFGRGPELSSDYSTIEEKSLQGGYILANMKIDTAGATFFPFVRWQYYDGGRKFGRNSPHVNLDEWDFGLEYSPWKDVELTAMYTYSNSRTNSNDFPYEDLRDESRLGMQVQVNY